MPFQLHIDEIMIVLQLLRLCKLRQLKSVNKEWRGACRRTLTSTSWLLGGKSDKDVRKLFENYGHTDSYYSIFFYLEESCMGWKIPLITDLVSYHTFTLPFYTMTQPQGICFSGDGYGPLNNRANIVHDLSIEDGKIMRIVIETQEGIFSTLDAIFENLFIRSKVLIYLTFQMDAAKMMGSRKYDFKEKKKARNTLRKEFYSSRDSFILRHLLPCIRIGNVYVSSDIVLNDFFGPRDDEEILRARLVI